MSVRAALVVPRAAAAAEQNSGFTERLGGRRCRPAGVLPVPGTAPGRQRATQATRDLLGNNRLPGSLSSAKLAQPRETGCWLGGRSVSNRGRPRPHQRRRLGSHPAACRPRSGLRQGSFVQLTNGSPAALRETRRSAGLARARNRSPSLNQQAQPRVAADPVTQDGKCTYIIHQPRPVEGTKSTHGGAVQAVRHHEL